MAKNAKAVSKDSAKFSFRSIGPVVIAGLAKALRDEQEALALLASVEAKRRDLLSDLVAAIVQVAKADSTIDLTAAFDSGTDAKKLNDQLGLALGFYEVVTGKGGIKKVATAKAVSEFFPMPGENKNDPAVKAKVTVRNNFAHTLKKCSRAALIECVRKVKSK